MEDTTQDSPEKHPATLDFDRPEATGSESSHSQVEETVPAGTRSKTTGNPYVLKSVHGKGGLGLVWLARDSRLNRDVALKQLLPNHESSPETIHGFLKEAQITAQLEHPNIVPVYELGPQDTGDEPYYTMRLIRGKTLADAIGEFHRHDEAKHSPLRQRQLLAAFMAVCNAIAFAHDRGVIHRDLKPQNIVLGDFGEVIVLDWGLAKLVGQPESSDTAQPGHGDFVSLSDTADTEKTKAGRVLGTPSYMAPEQAAGDTEAIGPATDIYGLGAILFSILTGKPPHSGTMVLTLLDKIANGPTPQAREWNPRIPPALNAICAKAMERSSDKRYPAAGQLASDIERWLADEPVSAFRDPLITRAVRWAKGHKVLVVGAAVLLVTALVALSVNSVMIRAEKQRTEAALRKAENNYASALQAVEEMLQKVGHEDLKHVPQMESIRRELLERALAFYQRFLHEMPDDPTLRFEIAKTNYHVAEILQKLDRHDEAIDGFRRTAELCRQLTGQSDRHVEQTRLLATALIDLGESHRMAGELDRAEQAYQQAAQVLREIPAGAADEVDQRELARATYNRGIVLHRTNDTTGARQSFEQANELLQEVVRLRAFDDKALQELARVKINYGSLLKDAEEFEAAEASYRQAINHLERLVVVKPKNRNYREELATAFTNLGNLLLERPDRQADARVAFEDSLRQLEDLAARSPNVPNYQNQLARTLNSLGGVMLSHAPESTAQLWQRSLGIYRKLTDELPHVTEYQSMHGATAGNLAYVVLRENDIEHARSLLKEAIERQREALAANPENSDYRKFLQNHYRTLADLCLKTGDHRQAAATAELLAAAAADWKDHYRAAMYLARCVAAANDSANLPNSLPANEAANDAAEDTASRHADSERYAVRAIELLRQAMAGGFGEVDFLDKQPEFQSIRQRPEFEKLRQEMTAATKGKDEEAPSDR